MKVYLAGPCDTESRTNMVKIAKIFREYGKFEVYCPWELKIENAWDYTQENWAKQVFESDIMAIQECDIFIMISQGRISSAGTNWEQGYAYALHKWIIVIQITDNPTSLMTYCSASNFFNTKPENFNNMLRLLIDNINKNGRLIHGDNDFRCETILT